MSIPPAGGWTPSGNVVVTGTLTLTNGNITLGTNNISLHNSSTGSTASHIIINSSGRVIAVDVAASQSRVIPIGIDAASYNPVWLVSNTGHTTDNFTIGVVEGVFVNGVSGAQFDTHVVDRMWLINEGTAGGSNVNLTLQWNGTEELTGFDRTRAYIMQYVGTGWVPGLENAAFGANPYSLTRLNVTSFGAFAVQKQPIPRPLTGIYPNPTKGTLNVVVDLPAAQKVWFTVFDAAGKKVHEANANLNAGLNLYTMDMAYLSGGLYFIKVSILSNPEYMLTKFIRE